MVILKWNKWNPSIILILHLLLFTIKKYLEGFSTVRNLTSWFFSWIHISLPFTQKILSRCNKLLGLVFYWSHIILLYDKIVCKLKLNFKTFSVTIRLSSVKNFIFDWVTIIHSTNMSNTTWIYYMFCNDYYT